MLSKVYTALRSDYSVAQMPPANKEDLPQTKPTQKGRQYITQSLSQYSKKEQKLISHIYRILSAILPHDTATMVINKIQEELSK